MWMNGDFKKKKEGLVTAQLYNWKWHRGQVSGKLWAPYPCCSEWSADQLPQRPLEAWRNADTQAPAWDLLNQNLLCNKIK